MRTLKGHRKTLFILCPFFLVTALLIAGYFIKSQVIEIGDGRILLRAGSGEIFTHCFMHSMYDVSVCEKFRVGKGSLTLFHVETESKAALEYYGIENNKEDNVRRTFTEIIIPAESAGRHRFIMRERKIHPDESYAKGRHIRIRLVEISATARIFNEFWR
jgi:hypothetical protein